MAHWTTFLGPVFHPDIPAADYLHEGLLRLLSDEEASRYDRDRECWQTYLDDPASELGTLCVPGAARMDQRSQTDGTSLV